MAERGAVLILSCRQNGSLLVDKGGRRGRLYLTAGEAMLLEALLRARRKSSAPVVEGTVLELPPDVCGRIAARRRAKQRQSLR